MIFANGERPTRETASDAATGADLLVAADGGAAAALVAGIVPDIVIGDLDSFSTEQRRSLPAAAVIEDVDPNRTDLQKAIDLCLERGVDEVVILGAGGARADHALANLSVLVMYRGRLTLSLIDDRFFVSLVDGSVRFEGPVGTVVSLVGIGTCAGVTTSGLRWDLDNATVGFTPLGVHNEIANSPVTIDVGAGDLLLFRGRWIEKHR